MRAAPAAYPCLVRLVSLLPSATEIVYALGLGEDLVGVTFECDEPPAARSEKTIVVGGRDTRGMTAREIDSYVRAQLAAGTDLYTLHARALADLRPDLILTQDLCRVCALPSGHVEEALGYLGCQADVLSLDPHSLDEVLDSILEVGRRTGVPDRAARLVNDLRARLARVAAASPGAAAPGRGGRVGGPAVHRRALDTGPRQRSGRAAGRGPARRAVCRRRAGLPSPRRHPNSSLSRHAVITCPARSSRRRLPPRRCPACRSGRSTPTASWSARDPAWWMASRPSPRWSTPAPCPPRSPRPCTWSRRPADLGGHLQESAGQDRRRSCPALSRRRVLRPRGRPRGPRWRCGTGRTGPSS